jgi:hypothetical protein
MYVIELSQAAVDVKPGSKVQIPVLQFVMWNDIVSTYSQYIRREVEAMIRVLSSLVGKNATKNLTKVEVCEHRQTWHRCCQAALEAQ